VRIAFDLDGVLADLHRAFADAALKLYPHLDPSLVSSPETGASPPTDDDAVEGDSDAVPPAFQLSRRQGSAVWKDLCGRSDFWESLEEIEHGAIARIAAIAEERRWEVLFITSRPDTAGRTVQRQSQRWIARCGFTLPSVYVVQGSRGRIAEALQLDVVVDDRADNCLDVVLESKARAILVWRGTAETVPASAKRLGIGVVPTVAACLDVLVEAEQAAATPLDFIQRLRRLLGVAPKTADTKR
jgi:hypothetical protein